MLTHTITVGWGNAQQNEPSFGGGSAADGASVKAKTINLINSVRTLMRSTWAIYLPFPNAILPYQGRAMEALEKWQDNKANATEPQSR